MRRSLGVGLALILAMAMMIMGSAPARATPPQAAVTDGEILSIDVVDIRFAGGNIHLDLVTTAIYWGTWNGFATTEFEAVFYRSGAVSARGVLTCECTVEDKSGTLTFQARYLIDADGTLRFSAWQFLHGTDGLANIHGQGSLEQLGIPGIDPSPFRFVGQYHFDP